MRAPIEIDIGNMLQTAIHVVTVCLVFLLGTLNQQIQYFYLGLLIDTCLGVWLSCKTGNFSRKYLIAKTIEKFVIYTLLIAAGHIGDMVGGLNDNQVRGAVILGLLVKEAPSFLGKFKALGYKEEAQVLEDTLLKNTEERGGTNEDGK